MTMTRTPIIGQVEQILQGAPSHPASGFPQTFTHRELAIEVYGVGEPTPAQLSAVRRVVARLVRAGKAEREPERAWSSERKTGSHLRRDRKMPEFRLRASNPGGVLLRRPFTDADRAARAAVLAGSNLAEAEATLARRA